jgi:uncharacterized membrane protein (DUF373 family)
MRVEPTEGGGVPDSTGSDELANEPLSMSPRAGGAQPEGEPWWTRYATMLTEHAQDVVTALVAATLVVLAAGVLVASVVDFFTSNGTLELRATDFLDRVLLVLIVVEIVHTVVLSLRAHALAAQPFLVVGLVAVIRKILFALGSQQRLSTSTLGIYVAMVAVFVASLVAIEVFGGHRQSRTSPDEPSIGLH